MLLLEKMETALDSTDLGEMLTNIRSGKILDTPKDSLQEFLSTSKKRISDSLPFARRGEMKKLEKKISNLSRKLNKLRKEFNEL